MDRLEEAVRRAGEAESILRSPMWETAFQETRQAVLEALAALPNMRDERAQDLHRMVTCLEKVKRCLEEHITSGKLASKEIEGRKRLFEFRRQA